MQHNFVFKFHTHSLEWNELPIEPKPYSPQVKNISTEPLLAQSSKGAPHTLYNTTHSPPLPPNKSKRYAKLVLFNPVTDSQITKYVISKSP